MQAQQAETVEKRKAERHRDFLPPEETRSAPPTGSEAAATTSGSGTHGGESDEVDVAAIKKKVSKAMKKVCIVKALIRSL